MAVTILKNPFTSSTQPITFNNDGNPFVVTSDRKDRANYTYIADLYVQGKLQARLKRNPDIGTKLGVFEMQRIMDSFLTEQQSVTKIINSANPQRLVYHWEPYYVKFGEAYSRTSNFNSVTNSGGNRRYNLTGGHNLRIGDRVYIEPAPGTTLPVIARFETVTGITTTSFLTNAGFSGSFTGKFTEAEGFYDNAYAPNTQAGLVGFLIPKSRPTRIKTGDNVRIVQDGTPTNPAYDGEWLVTGVESFNTTYDIIKTNCPFGVNTPPEGGAILSLNDYEFTNQTTTTTVKTINGGSDYTDLLNISSFYPTNSSTRFLTNGPKTHCTRGGEALTFAFVYNNSNNRVTYKIYVEQLTHPSYTPTAPGQIVLLGNLTNYYKVGDTVGTSAGTTTVTGVNYISIFNNTTVTFSSTGITPTSIWLISRTLTQTVPSSYSGELIIDARAGIDDVSTLTNWPIQDVQYYEMWIANLYGTQLSETMTVRVCSDCSGWTPYRIAWLNRLGGWDYYTFKGGDIETTNITRTAYRKQLRELDSLNNWTYTVGDRGDTTFNVDAQKSYSVWSPSLSRDEYEWLLELWTSPRVYWVTDTQVRPINVINDSYELLGSNAPGIKKVNLEFTVAWTENIQNG